MNRTTLSPAVALAAVLPLLPAQSPDLLVTPAAQPGGRLEAVLIGNAGEAFVTLADVHGGPVRLLGETFHLGFTGAVVALDAGVIPLGGFRAVRLPLPASAPVGVPLYLQSATLGPAQRLRASDGESAVAFASRFAMVQDFRDAVAEGMTGTFDHTVRGRVQAAAPRRRVHDLVPGSGATPFGQPIAGPLNPYGVRQQNVYRAVDLGADGRPEMVTRIAWRPFGPILLDAIGQLRIRASHSQVVPDYSIDPFSALPRFPDSGLSSTLSSNVKRGEQQQVVYSGGYVIDPANLQPDGYMPYPDLQQPFEYNGIDSLLLDFSVPANTANGSNGQRIWLMVSTSPRPDARAYTAGSPGNLVLTPDAIVNAERGDNSWFEIQLELVRVESEALSPWLAAPTSTPDYHDPYASMSVPAGAAISIEYRGATRPDGSDATPWFLDIDGADRKPWLQYRVRFRAALGGAVPPSLDQLVIPVD